VHVLGIQFDADKTPIQPTGNQAHGADAREGIQDEVIDLGGCEQARLNEFRGE